jgi:hypothetical protein
VIALLSRELAGRDPDVRVSPRLLSQSLRLRAVRDIFDGVPRETLRYLNHPVRFDTRRAEAVLGRHGLRCPRLQDYVGPMVAFYREHEHDPALSPSGSR